MSNLGPDDRDLIKGYIFSQMVIPIGFAGVLGGAMGWFINDIAKREAYMDAYQQTQEDILKNFRAALTAEQNAASAEKEISESKLKMEQSLNTVEAIVARVEGSKELLDSIDGQMEKIALAAIQNPEFSLKVSGSLGEQIAELQKDVGELKDAFDKESPGPLEQGQKVCVAIMSGSWRDGLLVPATWSRKECVQYAKSSGVTHTVLGCVFSDRVSFGSIAAGIPSDNCGWR